MKIMQTWITNNYPNPDELCKITDLTKYEAMTFFKSLKIKINKVKEDTMKNKIDINFNTDFVNLSD